MKLMRMTFVAIKLLLHESHAPTCAVLLVVFEGRVQVILALGDVKMVEHVECLFFQWLRRSCVWHGL